MKKSEKEEEENVKIETKRMKRKKKIKEDIGRSDKGKSKKYRIFN